MKELKIKAVITEKMANKDYEVEWYNKDGNVSHYVRLETLEDLGLYLSGCCWGCVRWKNNPTIYKDGERFCFAENPLEIEWIEE